MTRGVGRRAPLVVFGLLALIPLTGEYAGIVGSLAVVFSLVALGFVMLTGFTGDVSLGQVVPFGLGAYMTYFLSETVGMPVTLAIPLAAVAVAPLVALIGLPALRLRGLDLAIATFALALVFQLLVFKNLSQALADESAGLTDFSSLVVQVDRPSIGPVKLASNSSFYVGALAIGLVAYLAVAGVVRSAHGRTLLAVRDDPTRAEVLGIPVRNVRLGAFVIAGVVTALAGGILASLRQSVTPETFTIFESLNFLAMAIIGGVGGPRGAVLGGTFGAVLPEVARLDPFRFLQGRLILVYGLAVVVLLVLRPGGLASLLGWDRRPAPRLLEPQAAAPAAPRRARHSLLRLDGVTVTYGGVRAVDRVSLRVADGECVALIGPNGAGKSSLFDAVSGLLAPAEGRVFFAGEEIGGLATHERAGIGMARTFQNARVFATLTVAENLVAAAAVHAHVGEAEQIAARLLAELGLAPVSAVLPSELPFGSLRTLEVAMALASGPRLLLLDEPAAGMDAADIDDFCALIDWVRASGQLSVLLVEHDMTVVSRLAERVYVLDQGHVIAAGTPAEVAADPAVISSYLGTSADLLSTREPTHA